MSNRLVDFLNRKYPRGNEKLESELRHLKRALESDCNSENNNKRRKLDNDLSQLQQSQQLTPSTDVDRLANDLGQIQLSPFDISVGVWAFVIGLSQISSFFS